VIAGNLAAQSHAGETALREDVLFGFRHLVRFAGDEFDATGGAGGVPAAGVELIDSGLIGQRKNEAFSVRDCEIADALNR
jgi:hypothetical protein